MVLTRYCDGVRCTAILAILLGCSSGGEKPAPRGERLAYTPSDVAYTFDVKSATGAGAPIQLAATASGRFRFATRADGRMDFSLESATVSVDGPGLERRMEGDRTRLVLKDNGKVMLELAAGQKSPTGATLDDMFGKPMHSIRLAATGPDGAPESDDDHPLVKSGMVDFTAMSLFALPTFPARPVAIGETWRVTRMVPHSVRIVEDIPIELAYTLVSIDACEGGAGRCARLAFKGATAPTQVTDQGRAATVKYTFTGTSVFAVSTGVAVNSEFDMAMQLATGGADFPFGARYVIARVP